MSVVRDVMSDELSEKVLGAILRYLVCREVNTITYLRSMCKLLFSCCYCNLINCNQCQPPSNTEL